MGTRRRFRRYLLATCVLGIWGTSALAASPSAETAASEAPAAEAKKTGGAGWGGRVDAREEYRFRSSGATAAVPSESDQDLRVFLDAEGETPVSGFGAETSLGLWWDLDGRAPGRPFGLASMRDVGSSAAWLEVYQLSVLYRGDGLIDHARVGRQEAEFGRPAIFDGASVVVDTGYRGLDLFAFGGRSVYFFAVDPGVSDNLIASGGAQWRASNRLKLVADYRLLHQDWTFPATKEGDGLTDHLYGLTGWWRARDTLNVKAWARGLDGKAGYGGAAGRLAREDGRLGVEALAEGQFVTMRDFNELDNPYFQTLGESLPHLKMRVDGWRGWALFGGDYEAHLGLEARQLLKGEESLFNRNAQRAYLLLSGADIATKGLSANVTLDYHLGQQSQLSGFFTLSGGVGYERGRVRGEVGSFFQRWEYVYYRSAEEFPNVRGVFADARVKLIDGLALRGRYVYEVFDRQLHTATFSLSQAY